MYIHLGLLFCAQAAGILAWCQFGLSKGLSRHLGASFICAGCVDPRAAFFVMIVYTSETFIFCAGCGDPCLVSFWPLPGTVPGISGASFGCAGCADPRAALFCFGFVCIYIWGLYFVRRLRGSVSGVILASPRGCPWRLGGLFYMRRLRRSACGIFFDDYIYIYIYTSGAFILCAGCGDPCLLHFGFFQWLPCGLSVSLWWYFFTQTAAICVRKHVIVTPAREPLQAQGSPGLVWALLGSSGLP